ncbi:helix-turn-helix transcriptional regulator [Streptomyces sp. NPDC093018]|uniref:helix-turn-helix transcriptional regulator n=1 Tax=Streptomyces sp. NPDC093018 TaxID=3155067 RepID=UPI00343DAE8A
MSETPFGRRLRALRRQRALSQNELAGSELSASYVSLLESGKRPPTEEAVVKLAARLGISVAELVGDTGVVPSRPTLEQPLEAELLLNRALLALRTGSADVAAGMFAELAAVDDDTLALQARTLLGRAQALEWAGRLAEAADLYRQWLDLFADGCDDPVLRVETVISLLRCQRETGAPRMAAKEAEEALAAADELALSGTPVGLELAGIVAGFRWDLGQDTAALDLLEEAYGTADGLVGRADLAQAYGRAADAAEARGRLAHAVALARRGAEVCHRADALCPVARLRLAGAEVLARRSATATGPASQPPLEPYAAELAAWGSPLDAAVAEAERSRELLATGDAEGARNAAHSALDSVGPAWRRTRAHASLALGRALWRLGDAAGVRYFEEAADALAAVGAERQSAAAYLELAELLETEGDVRGALSYYRRASAVVGLLPAESS